MANQNSDIEFQGYVLAALIKYHNFSQLNAKRLIEGSTFLRLLADKPEYVYHRNANYWADEIIIEAARETR